MEQKEKILREFLKFWNARDLLTCAQKLTEDVELHSSYALKIFPESNGILKGKELVLEYLKLIFSGFVDIEVIKPIITKEKDYFIVRGDNNSNTLNYYLHYYINNNNLIYLVKSNMTQPIL